MSRSTVLAVAAGLPAGVLLAVIAHGVAHIDAGNLDPAAQAVAFTTAVSAAGSAAFWGVKAGIDRHEETARGRRHRRAPGPVPRRRPRIAPPLTISAADADQVAAADRQVLAEPAQAFAVHLPEQAAEDGKLAGWVTMPWGGRIPQEDADLSVEQEDKLRDLLDAERSVRPDYVDPYLAQAAEDWPTEPVPVVDEHADLYAHPGQIQAPADTAEDWITQRLNLADLRGRPVFLDDLYPHLPASPA